jgi:hypothetical protein
MNKINMKTEIKLLTDFKNKLSSIQHPNISIEIFPPDKRLGDFERADIIYYSSLRVSVFHGTLRARVYANQSSK